VQPASRTVPEDIPGTIVRILAYIGAVAILSVAAASLFRTPELVTSTDDPAPRPKWIDVDRPHAAVELLVPELGGAPSRYAILRRDADGARKDVLTWGEPAGSGPYVMVEIYRPGSSGERFLDAAGEIAARIIEFPITDDVKAAGQIESKFGAMSLVDFAIAPEGQERRCLGFARAFDTPAVQIAGWYCSTGQEVVNRATLACAFDRLTIMSAGGDDNLAQWFAHAELKRTFCGQRNTILAATPERRDSLAGPLRTMLRGRIRPR